MIAIQGNTVISKHRFKTTSLRWGRQILMPPILEWLVAVRNINASTLLSRIFILVEEPLKQMGPKTTAQAIQSTGVSFGKIIAAVEAMQGQWPDVAWDTVIPRTWQTVFFKPGGDTKAKSISSATRLFPGADFRISEAGKTPHDGFTDAALIAEFARRANF